LDKDTKDLLTFGGIILGGIVLWHLWKDKKYYKCPQCNYPLNKSQTPCPNCNQNIDWRDINGK